MKLKAFFDNLNVYFEDEDSDVPVKCNAYKNESGDVVEIRIFNPQYNEFMIVTEDGEVEALSIEDMEDLVDKN